MMQRLCTHFVLLGTLLLGACGWQIQGVDTEAYSNTTQIRYEGQVTSSFKQLLDRQFVTASQAETPYRVVILEETRDEHTQTLTPRLHTGIERLEKKLSYRIESGDGERSEQASIMAWRDLDVVDNNPAATDVERRDLEVSINRELLSQLLRHLDRFAREPEA